MTFEDYLKEANKHGIIDFHLRADQVGGGRGTIYIHPAGKNGRTADLVVVDDSVYVQNITGDWPPEEPRRCRRCGCTDDQACEGGCWWVEPDLCSACQDVGELLEGDE